MKELQEDQYETDDYEKIMREFSVIDHYVSNTVISDLHPQCITFIDIALESFAKYYNKDSCMKLMDVVVLPSAYNCNKNTFKTVFLKEVDCSRFIILCRDHNNSWSKCASGFMFETGWKNKSCFSGELSTVSDITIGIENINKTHVCKDLNNLNPFIIKFEISQNLIGVWNRECLHPCAVDYVAGLSIKSRYGSSWRALYYGEIENYGKIESKVFVSIKELESDKSNEKKLDIVVYNRDLVVIIYLHNCIIQSEEGKLRSSNYTNRKEAETVITCDKQNVQDDSVKLVSGLTWREMDCYERCIALLLGHEDNEFILYYKLFLCIMNCYNLDEFVKTPNREWSNNKVLEILGYEETRLSISCQKEINERLADYMTMKQPLIIPFDEYFIFYTSFYLKQHTNHCTVINGINKDTKLYNIVDHNHLEINNTRQKISYGKFYVSFDIIEKIFSSKSNNTVVMMNEINPDEGNKFEQFHDLFINMVEYVIGSEQTSKEINIIYDQVVENDVSLDTEVINQLYRLLGKRELFIDTITNYFCSKSRNKDAILDLAYKLINNCNLLVNKYVASMFRNRVDSKSDMLKMIFLINEDTKLFLNEIIRYK